MKGRNKKSTLIAASIAGLVAMVGAMSTAGVVYAEGTHCSGINACKGQGECGGEGHSCAGKNGCKGAGWVTKASDAECAAAGGTVLPAAAPAAPAA